eukprot:332888_1
MHSRLWLQHMQSYATYVVRQCVPFGFVSLFHLGTIQPVFPHHTFIFCCAYHIRVTTCFIAYNFNCKCPHNTPTNLIFRFKLNVTTCELELRSIKTLGLPLSVSIARFLC